MTDPSDIMRSYGGTPLYATREQLAAASQAVADVYDAWADGIDTTPPPGGFTQADGAVWGEAVNGGGPDPEVTRAAVIAATPGTPEQIELARVERARVAKEARD